MPQRHAVGHLLKPLAGLEAGLRLELVESSRKADVVCRHELGALLQEHGTPQLPHRTTPKSLDRQLARDVAGERGGLARGAPPDAPTPPACGSACPACRPVAKASRYPHPRARRGRNFANRSHAPPPATTGGGEREASSGPHDPVFAAIPVRKALSSFSSRANLSEEDLTPSGLRPRPWTPSTPPDHGIVGTGPHGSLLEGGCRRAKPLLPLNLAGIEGAQRNQATESVGG